MILSLTLVMARVEILFRIVENVVDETLSRPIEICLLNKKRETIAEQGVSYFHFLHSGNL